MVTIIERNLLDDDSEANFQCLNCQCAQNSGVAAAIKRKWPSIERADNDFKFPRSDPRRLGEIVRSNENGKVLYGIFGQFFYGREKRQLNYEAFYSGLEKIKSDMIFSGLTSIGTCYKVGCDRAGGNWNIVRTMIEEVLGEFKVNICKI